MKRILCTCILLLTGLVNGCSQQISEDEAKQIALSHAGLLAADVTFMKTEIEYDGGYKYYDVEFYVPDQTEYNYEIDIQSGEILEWDTEPIYNTAH